MKYAEPYRRFAAFLIDMCVLMALYILLGFLLGLSALSKQLMALPLLGLWFFGGLFGMAWFYYAISESSKWQATLGKKIVRIQVVSVKGERIGFWRASVRYFGKLISRLAAFLGLLMIFFTEKKQALHDKIAATVVIQK